MKVGQCIWMLLPLKQVNCLALNLKLDLITLDLQRIIYFMNFKIIDVYWLESIVFTFKSQLILNVFLLHRCPASGWTSATSSLTSAASPAHGRCLTAHCELYPSRNTTAYGLSTSALWRNMTSLKQLLEFFAGTWRLVRFWLNDSMIYIIPLCW